MPGELPIDHEKPTERFNSLGLFRALALANNGFMCAIDPYYVCELLPPPLLAPNLMFYFRGFVSIVGA